MTPVKKNPNAFNIFTLQQEIESIVEDTGKQENKADFQKWLVRLYKAGAMLAIVQQQYTLHPSINPAARKEERLMLAEIPGSLDMLNVQIMQTISVLRNMERETKS